MIRCNSISEPLLNKCPLRFSLIRATALLTLISGSAWAQDKGFLDSLRKDSVNVLMFQDTAVQQAHGKPDFTIFRGDTLLKSPWGAVLRSLVMPGWGQWYNESKWKTPLFITTDGAMLYFYHIKDKNVQSIERKRRRIDRQLKTDPFLTPAQRSILSSRFSDLTSDLDGALNNRNLYGWLFALSHLLCMIDAYVDAHLFKFDAKMDLAIQPIPAGCLVSWTLELK